jgi:hypothetical protein
MGKPKPPTPPDPIKTADAQTGTNIDTAIANNTMGMVDQITPDGSLKYTQTGSYTDAKGRVIPRYTSTQALSPEQQRIKDQNQTAQFNMAETGANQSAFLRDYLGTPANMDTSAIEGRLSELGRARLDPLMAQRRSGMDSKLANQGIAQGSEAYNREMTMLGQQENDAYNSLFLTGRGQARGELEQDRMRPLNEINALLSGTQVQNPNTGSYTPQGMPTVDMAGLINQNYGQRQQNYQTSMAQRQGLMGGLFGLGAKAISGGLF